MSPSQTATTSALAATSSHQPDPLQVLLQHLRRLLALLRRHPLPLLLPHHLLLSPLSLGLPGQHRSGGEGGGGLGGGEGGGGLGGGEGAAAGWAAAMVAAVMVVAARAVILCCNNNN